MLVVLAVICALAVLPQMWVRRVIAAHDAERADFPGTGGEFARHILDEMKLGHVKVEETDAGDHYDPEAKAIRQRMADATPRAVANLQRLIG